MQAAERGWAGRPRAIELLVVLAVMLILVGIAVASVSHFRQGSQSAACAADTQSLENAEEANYAQSGVYDEQPGLVSRGLLSHPSNWHQVSVAENGLSYAITILGDRCGHPGDSVQQSAADH